MLRVTQEVRGGWCVVGVTGRADVLSASELEAGLCAAIQQNPQVVVDLSSVDYISSCGLRALLQSARAAQAGNVRFVVCSLSAPVKKVFDISRLGDILEVQAKLPC